MKGDEVIPKGDVLVEGNRITAVGATGTVTIPPDATVINVRGKTIMPGLLDLHDHFHPIREVIPQRHWSLAAHLAYGVTTSFDPSADNNAVFGTAEMVEAGELTGPRIYSTGTALNVRAAKIESLEDARHIVRRYKEHGAIALKEYLQPRRVQRQWIMMAAAEEGLNVTADGGGHLAFDMTHALDGYSGFEHSMPVTPVYKDVIELMAQSKTYYSPTLIVELVGPWVSTSSANTATCMTIRSCGASRPTNWSTEGRGGGCWLWTTTTVSSPTPGTPPRSSAGAVSPYWADMASSRDFRLTGSYGSSRWAGFPRTKHCAPAPDRLPNVWAWLRTWARSRPASSQTSSY